MANTLPVKALFSVMVCSLVIVRYPKGFGWAGFLSMAVFRIPLLLQKKLSFWKLMGCGKNGTFDIYPDWRQWALLIVADNSTLENGQHLQTPGFIQRWWRMFRCETCCFHLQPIEGIGTWNGRKCFGELARQTDYDGKIAILTRATIRLQRLKAFWKNVAPVAAKMVTAEGFQFSAGIGEVPWIRQATFSIWESKSAMKAFAYKAQEHTQVIRKTRANDWYSEEMFVRFKILNITGTIRGKHPLAGKA